MFATILTRNTQMQIERGYDQIMRQSQTIDQHMALWEETQNTDSFATVWTQIKYSNQLSLPQQDNCKTRKESMHCITKQRLNKKICINNKKINRQITFLHRFSFVYIMWFYTFKHRINTNSLHIFNGGALPMIVLLLSHIYSCPMKKHHLQKWPHLYNDKKFYFHNCLILLLVGL